MKRFLEDGYVPMHNSGNERSIIVLCIGRYNWKGIESENGAAAACAYSIAETDKFNQADPFYYYKFLLDRFPSLLKEHLSYLKCHMPWTEDYRCYEQSEKERYQCECLVSYPRLSFCSSVWKHTYMSDRGMFLVLLQRCIIFVKVQV